MSAPTEPEAPSALQDSNPSGEKLESVGPYRIKGTLGRGGMGVVYRAVHETLERPVALKILPPEFAQNPEYVSRFLRVARVAATLRHDHIVQVYDAGLFKGRYYMAMELVEGTSLGKYVEQNGPLSESEGLRLLLQAALGLQAAHEKDLVHRDIKPDNLLLDEKMNVRIVDFGLVMESSSTTHLTNTGATLGTPLYMSPEQVDGEKADARSDLYSLGVTFFRAFTSKLPFEGGSMMNLLYKHKFEAPEDPRKFKPDLSKNLSNLLLTMMAKLREQRPQNAADLADLVRKVQEGKKIPNPPPLPPPPGSGEMTSVSGSAAAVTPITAVQDAVKGNVKILLAGAALGAVVLIAALALLLGGGEKKPSEGESQTVNPSTDAEAGKTPGEGEVSPTPPVEPPALPDPAPADPARPCRRREATAKRSGRRWPRPETTRRRASWRKRRRLSNARPN
ncbi:MAG: serine/threonine protein kinase [Planctomycetota bacterium]|nr:serine/threonine protein kinase [Planctomycetota bacterium]